MVAAPAQRGDPVLVPVLVAGCRVRGVRRREGHRVRRHRRALIHVDSRVLPLSRERSALHVQFSCIRRAFRTSTSVLQQARGLDARTMCPGRYWLTNWRRRSRWAQVQIVRLVEDQVRPLCSVANAIPAAGAPNLVVSHRLRTAELCQARPTLQRAPKLHAVEHLLQGVEPHVDIAPSLV